MTVRDGIWVVLAFDVRSFDSRDFPRRSSLQKDLSTKDIFTFGYMRQSPPIVLQTFIEVFSARRLHGSIIVVMCPPNNERQTIARIAVEPTFRIRRWEPSLGRRALKLHQDLRTAFATSIVQITKGYQVLKILQTQLCLQHAPSRIENGTHLNTENASGMLDSSVYRYLDALHEKPSVLHLRLYLMRVLSQLSVQGEVSVQLWSEMP